jgi:hypothetical protein
MIFYMNSMEKTVTELHGMLKTVEGSIKNSNHVMMVQKEKKKMKR